MKHNTVAKVAIRIFKYMGRATLWYVGFFAVAIAIIQIVFFFVDNNGSPNPMRLSETTIISQRIYLLVIGIVYPLTVGEYLVVGVTRKQFAHGLSVSGFALSLCFCVLQAVLMLLDGTFSPFTLLSGIAYGIFYFFLGWVAVAGFQLKRVYTAAIGLICAHMLLWGVITFENLAFAEWAKTLAVFIATGLMIAALTKAIQYTSIKC
jgi:hypothetical protein